MLCYRVLRRISFLALCKCIKVERVLLSIQQWRYLKNDAHAICRSFCSWQSREKGNVFRKGSLFVSFVAAPLIGFQTVKRFVAVHAEEPNASDERESEEEEENALEWNPPERTDLPIITAEEISTHKTVDSKIWCSFRTGVYDITEFSTMHPGGDIIMQAAGGPLEPLWLSYSFHYQMPVLEILEELRIGTLDLKDYKQYELPKSTVKVHDQLPVELDPAMIMHSVIPLNAEPSKEMLIKDFLTPQKYFYKRNHLSLPDLDPNEYRLEVEGLNSKKKVFTMKDLRKFKPVTVVCVLQCSGNRRSEFSSVKGVSGINWQVGTVGNAEWKGVLLRDVLKTVGIKEKVNGFEHIQFEGYDTDENGQHYGASVPVEFVFDSNRNIILAYEMNGEPIPREHGFPLRVIVPGTYDFLRLPFDAPIRCFKSC